MPPNDRLHKLRDCETARAARYLGHTWFKNVLWTYLRDDRDRPVKTKPTAPEVPEYLAVLPHKIKEARDVLDGCECGLSPSHLVSRTWLDRLPEQTKQALARNLHEVFLASCRIQPVKAELKDALDGLEIASQRITTDWVDGNKRAVLIEDLYVYAERVWKALEPLGEGILLP